MRAPIVAALKMLAVLTLVVGVGYPLAVTAVAQIAFGHEADGSLVRVGDRVVGSSLIGQQFEGAEWFHPRPSAAGSGYDALASGGTNLGPTNPELLETVAQRVEEYREVNRLADDAPVPVDAVTASASGLDPHISEANAALQARRVADERGLPLSRVRRLIEAATDQPVLGFLGQPGVNVLELNLALRRAARP